MAMNSVTPDDARKIFKGKQVLIIGDSISRGIYKDISCLLFGHNRLLSYDELRFNRHKNEKHSLFGESIDLLQTDRSNSTRNLENRKVISTDHDYYLYYSFISRIWNRPMHDLLPKLEQFDCIIIQSMIWDLTRYQDYHGNIYLQNLHTFLPNVTQFNKKIIWPIIPPSDSSNCAALNERILKTRSSLIEILQSYDCAFVDLLDLLANFPEIRHADGLHFTPTGHRHITHQLLKVMSNMFEQHGITNSSIELLLTTDSANADTCVAPAAYQSTESHQVQQRT